MADFSQEPKYNYNWQSSKFKDLTFSGSLISQFVNDTGYADTGSNIFYGNQTITGSTSIKGTTQISGSVGITGSFNVMGGDINIVSGSSFTRWGNKLFNYGQFYDTTTQSGSANTAYSMKLNMTDLVLNTRIVSQSRITVDNTGIYNLQFSAQLSNTANTTIEFDIWFAYTGSNIPHSSTSITVNKVAGSNGRAVAAWNYATTIQANDYIEIKWACSAATGQILALSSSSIYPEIPSVIATLTQIA